MSVSVLCGTTGACPEYVPCVVCRAVLPLQSLGGVTFCRQSLQRTSIGDFLVKLAVVPPGDASLSSPICHECLLYAASADRAYAIAEENVAMLKARRTQGLPESGVGEQGSESTDSSDVERTWRYGTPLTLIIGQSSSFVPLHLLICFRGIDPKNNG
jgi:hypothetical protein